MAKTMLHCLVVLQKDQCPLPSSQLAWLPYFALIGRCDIYEIWQYRRYTNAFLKRKWIFFGCAIAKTNSMQCFSQCEIEFWGYFFCYFMEFFGFSGKMVVFPMRSALKNKIFALRNGTVPFCIQKAFIYLRYSAFWHFIWSIRRMRVKLYFNYEYLNKFKEIDFLY